MNNRQYDYITFKQFHSTDPIFTNEEISEYGWSEGDVKIAEELYNKVLEDITTQSDIDLDSPEMLAEGILGSVLGATAGFALGPAIGKAIAKVLGAEKNGILYKMLTSRVVAAALGEAIFRGK